MHDPIEDALRALLETVRREAGKDAKKALDELAKHIDRLREAFRQGAADWQTAPPQTIAELRHTDRLYLPARLRASVVKGSEPILIQVLHDGEMRNSLYGVYALRDRDGNEVETVGIIDEPTVHMISGATTRHAGLEFLGRMVPVPPGLGTALLRFAVEAVRPVETSLQIVDADEAEIEFAEQTRTELRSRGQTPLEFIKAQLVDNLDIVGVDQHPALSQSLDFVVLQALSNEAVGNASGRLHALIVGAPGSGKKLTSRAAQVCSCAFEEGHPAKLTVSGLCGYTRIASGGFQSSPGLIPLAHQGVVSIQDAHSIPSRSRAAVYAALSLVMEDGQVLDSTASRGRFVANTSVLLDLNRKSDLRQDSNDLLADAGIPLNVLSRFDCIFSMPADAGRQAAVASRLHSRLARDAGSRTDLDDEKWVRRIRVLIAYLRDNLRPDTSRVEAEVTSKHLELITANRGSLALSDFQTRLAISAWKLVRAICRSRDKEVADGAVVNEAFRLLAPKIVFLRGLDPMITVPRSWSTQDRREWAKSEFAGTEFGVENMRDRYEAASGNTVSERTMYRDLKDLGAQKRGTARYYLSPPRATGVE